MKKIAGLFFLLMLVLLSLVACGDSDGDGKTKDSNIGKGTKWETVDFSGTTLRISVSVDQNMGNSTPTSVRYLRGSDEATSDDVVNLASNRNKDVSDMLGIDVQYVEAHNQYNEVQTYIEELVMANTDETPDIFIDDVYGGIRAAMNGALYNVMDSDEKNYLELTEENGWYVDFMNGLTLNPAIKYFLAGDYFIDILRSCHVLFVNIDRYEESTGSPIEILYGDIKDGKWTYDYFATLIDDVWDEAPNNQSGYAQKDDDLIGFACSSICVYPFFYGSENSLYERDNTGDYSVPYEHSTYFSFARDIFDLLTAQAVFRTVGTGTDESRTSTYFSNGNVLLAQGMLLSEIEMPEIRAMTDRRGLIVFPKHSSAKNYNTYVHDLAEGGMIALSTENFSAATAYLQCINEYSADVRDSYAEYAVMFKYNKDAATVEMINLIYDSIGSPFEGIMGQLAFALGAGSNPPAGVYSPQAALTISVQANNNTFVNTYQKSYNIYVAGLNILKDKFGLTK